MGRGVTRAWGLGLTFVFLAAQALQAAGNSKWRSSPSFWQRLVRDVLVFAKVVDLKGWASPFVMNYPKWLLVISILKFLHYCCATSQSTSPPKIQRFKTVKPLNESWPTQSTYLIIIGHVAFNKHFSNEKHANHIATNKPMSVLRRLIDKTYGKRQEELHASRLQMPQVWAEKRRELFGGLEDGWPFCFAFLEVWA